MSDTAASSIPHQEIIVDAQLPLIVFGGPYSNLQAITAMKVVAEELAIPASQIICTGDVVAYCSEPEETSRVCMDWGIHVIQGNCEEQLAANADDCGCGFEEGTSCSVLSDNWYSYTKKNISDEVRNWMGALPRTLSFKLHGRAFRVIHGGYHEINQFIFPSTPSGVKEAEMKAAEADVIVAGHSGIPFIQKTASGVWFNPGVIGMPANDGQPDGWYGIIDAASDGIRFATKKLSYDHHTASARLYDAGFADPYARALTTGIWPSHDVLSATELAVTGNEISETNFETDL